MKTYALILCFLVATIVFLFKMMYLPTKEKLALSEQKNRQYEETIERMRNAELETSYTIQKLRQEIEKDSGCVVWASQPIPDNVLNVLRESYREATAKTSD